MKHYTLSIALTLLLLISGLTTYAQDKTYKLTVFVPEITKRTGKLYVGLANSDDTFTNASLKTVVVDVAATGETVAVFEGLPAGKYAVRLYQDINGNKELDRSGMMPDEPFGLSNVMMLMGPPAFIDSAFDLTGDMRLKVMMMNQDN